jgi:dolichol kinase
LDGIVERTSGPQPWRRVFHAIYGVAIASMLTWWPFSRTLALGTLTTVVAILLLFDVLRLRSPKVNVLFFHWFRFLASPREARGIASSTWYLAGVTLAVALAPGAAVSGILVLALADPAASYYGRRWGTRPFLGGTVEGSLVFLAVAMAVLIPRHGVTVALAAGIPAALLERRSWPVDDNLTVPSGTAVIASLLETWI